MKRVGRKWEGAEDRVELQREEERSENEGGIKWEDRRWEERDQGRGEGNIGVKGKKLSGEVTLHRDMENYYWSALACFFSSLFFTPLPPSSVPLPSSFFSSASLLQPSSHSLISFLLLFSACNLSSLQPLYRNHKLSRDCLTFNLSPLLSAWLLIYRSPNILGFKWMTCVLMYDTPYHREWN